MHTTTPANSRVILITITGALSKIEPVHEVPRAWRWGSGDEEHVLDAAGERQVPTQTS
jgi:hypothetical protein